MKYFFILPQALAVWCVCQTFSLKFINLSTQGSQICATCVQTKVFTFYCRFCNLWLIIYLWFAAACHQSFCVRQDYLLSSFPVKLKLRFYIPSNSLQYVRRHVVNTYPSKLFRTPCCIHLHVNEGEKKLETSAFTYILEVWGKYGNLF